MNYLRERVLEPILIPLAAAALIAFGALNLSRLFLASASADRAVIVGTLVAAAILGGAAWATSREEIDRGVLLGGAALLGVLLAGAGLLANEVDADRAAEERGGGEGAEFASEITVTAVDFDFPEKEIEAADGGGIKVNYKVQEGSHTFVVSGFEDELKLAAAAGESDSGVIKLDPGEYVFYCDVPGHRSLGMEGTLTVTEGSAEGGGAAAGPALEVTAADFKLAPPELQAQAGKVPFEYVNEGPSFHTLVVEGLEDEFKLEAAGGESDTGALDLQPGQYTLYCDVPGHRQAGMEATLTVT